MGRRFKARGVWIAAAIVLALAASELGLRALGRRLYQPAQLAPRAGAILRGGIWCLGDSFTQGSGAPPGYGYPEQLDRRLRAQGRPAATVNLGMGGTNSSQQLASLRSFLARGSPSVVVYMGGSNDQWSLVQADWRVLWRLRGASGVAYSFLQASRLFRLVVNYVLAKAVEGLRRPSLGDSLEASGPDEIASLLSTDRNEEVIGLLTPSRSRSPQQTLFLAAAYFADRRYARARDLFASLGSSLEAEDLPIDPRLWLAEAVRLEGGSGAKALQLYRDWRPNPLRAPEAAAYWLGRGWAELDSGLDRDAERSFNTAGQAIREDGSLWAQGHLVTEAMGWTSMLRGDARRAAALFDSLDAVDPDAHFFPPFWAWIGAAWIAAGSSDEGRFKRASSKAARRYPENLWGRYPLEGAWLCLVNARRGRVLGDPHWRSWQARARRLYPLRTAAGLSEPVHGLRDLPAQSLLHSLPVISFVRRERLDLGNALLRHNLQELWDLSRAHGFRLVLMTYPKPSAANETVRSFARAKGIPLVDLANSLGKIRADDRLRSEDGEHPNALGYGLMAEQVAGALAPEPGRTRSIDSPTIPRGFIVR